MKPASKVYEMVVRVAAPSLTTVMEVLTGSAELISMRQVEAEAAPLPTPHEPSRERREPFYADGKRDKGIKAVDAVLHIMQPGRVYNVRHLSAELVRRWNFAAASVNPAVSDLSADGRIERVGKGEYRLYPKPDALKKALELPHAPK